MYVASLTIENLRTLEKAKLDLNQPNGKSSAEGDLLSNVNLILGDNGAGKTSVLRAIAIAALSPLLASGSGFVPYSLVRRQREGLTLRKGRITADLVLHEQDDRKGSQRITTTILATKGWVDRFQREKDPPWAEPMWDERSAAFLLVGYGASRRVDPSSGFGEELRSKSRALRYSRVAGLFEEGVTLIPLSSWLPRFHTQNPGRHKQVVQLLNELLAPQAELLPEPVDGEFLFRLGGARLPFQALSDGYRAYVGWVADLLYHVCMGTPTRHKLVDNRGVVLVDEVDLHLHPEWQQRVIPTLARAFPNLQFVFTSHSPLVVGSLRKENVFVLESAETNGVKRAVLRPSDEEVYGLSSDQILTSGHFGLSSARDPGFTQHLREEARTADSGEPEDALRFMRLMALGAGAEEAETTAPLAAAAPAPKTKPAPKAAAAALKPDATRAKAAAKAPKPAAKRPSTAETHPKARAKLRKLGAKSPKAKALRPTAKT
jgi:hypothetical protein